MRLNKLQPHSSTLHQPQSAPDSRKMRLEVVGNLRTINKYEHSPPSRESVRHIWHRIYGCGPNTATLLSTATRRLPTAAIQPACAAELPAGSTTGLRLSATATADTIRKPDSIPAKIRQTHERNGPPHLLRPRSGRLRPPTARLWRKRLQPRFRSAPESGAKLSSATANAWRRLSISSAAANAAELQISTSAATREPFTHATASRSTEQKHDSITSHNKQAIHLEQQQQVFAAQGERFPC